MGCLMIATNLAIGLCIEKYQQRAHHRFFFRALLFAFYGRFNFATVFRLILHLLLGFVLDQRLAFDALKYVFQNKLTILTTTKRK